VTTRANKHSLVSRGIDASINMLQDRFRSCVNKRDIQILKDYGNGYVKISYTRQDILKAGFGLARRWRFPCIRVIMVVPRIWLVEEASR